jgi:tripartite-type tricarboxylate transporter receptor subunit TctC
MLAAMRADRLAASAVTRRHLGRVAVKVLRPFLIVLALLCPGLCLAQDFPNKTIRLIVPFPPGGPNDIIARVVGQRMSEILKQTIIIDNRSGQGGVIGTDVVAKSQPDGYTIGIVSAGALAISPSMEKVAYDTLKDLQPITLVAKVPEMLVVATSVPAKDMKELVALAKSQPGKLNFASSGPGSLPHLAGELFKLTANINIVHVPYRGAAPAVNDLLAQQVQMVFLDLPVLLPQIKAGKLKPIAVGAPQRVPSAPDVPTTAEAGMPNLLTENWYGMVAPAKTPPQIVAALNKAAVAAMKDQTVIDKLSSQGAILIGDSPEQFGAFIDTETKKWAKVIKDAGVHSEK